VGERAEDPLQVFRGNSDTRVADASEDALAAALAGQLNRAAGRRELDGIREQIEKDLLQPVRVSEDRNSVVAAGSGEL
jgi:hypothetical protein